MEPVVRTARIFRRIPLVAALAVASAACTSPAMPPGSDASDTASDAAVADQAAVDAGTDAITATDAQPDVTCTQTLCSGACIDTSRDPNHCGACDHACAFANSDATCASGQCALGACHPGFANCDGNSSNGCETNTGTDATNCGQCGTACTAPGTVCSSGVCRVGTCPTGTGDCDGNAANGCETDTRADLANCGTCGTRCAFGNAQSSCSASVCVLGACNAGFANCDGVDANGCEANLAVNRNHCGQCSVACSAAGMVCSNSMCVLGTCPSGTGDCDSNPTNGCETDTASSVSNCGGCGNSCSFPNAGAQCVAGACALGACSSGFANCDGNATNGCETNTSSSVANCGACGMACNFANASASCASGACVLGACAPNFANCDGAAANGCEANTLTNPANCGTCGNACSFPNAGALCMAGSCALGACNPGFANCDGIASNGCETLLGNDAANCGTCGHVCSFANAGASCAAGACVLGACAGGFANCDGNASNGCEADTTMSATNCGGCNRACAGPGAACAGGVCSVGTCPGTTGDCDRAATNGCEVNLATSLANCGACGTVCSLAHATPSCTGGSCQVATCTAPYGNCDGVASNGCEANTQTDVANCGACGSVCNLPNATSTCTAGACAITSCSAGRGNCDGVTSNGCETDLTANALNCGACGRTCRAGWSCQAGTCSPAACSSTQLDCNRWGEDGCETDTTTDRFNCGACGRACAPGAACVAGVCGAACPAFHADCDGNAANGCESASGMIAYWRMNEGTLESSWDYARYAGNLNLEVMMNAPTHFSTAIPPTQSAGYSLDCTSMSLTCAQSFNAIAWPGGPQFTIQAWIKTSMSAAGVVDFMQGSTGPFYALDVGNSGQIAATVWGVNTSNNTPTAFVLQSGAGVVNVSDNRWHHVAATANGSTLSIIIDGAVIATRTYTVVGAPQHTGRFLIGNGFVGQIDEVKVYAYARTPYEIESDALTFCRAPTCGTCATPPAHATATCVSGACATACVPGRGDCDGMASNGCETDLTTSAANCGACGAACGTGTVCNAGVCGLSCGAGLADCDGAASNGCEVNVLTDANHCGACQRVCNAGETCTNGSCVSSCFADRHSCGGTCQGIYTPSACGGSCTNCATGANGYASCDSNYCGQVCSLGWADCDGDGSNGCESQSQPVAWWRLGEGWGNTALDSSGNNNNLTLDGAGGGWSLAFPAATGAGASIVCSVGTSWRCGYGVLTWTWTWPFTLQAWVRVGPGLPIAAVVKIENVVTMSVDANGHVVAGTNTPVTGTTNVADGNWHLIAITGDGTTARTIVDGVVDGTGPYAPQFINYNTPMVYIGGYPAAPYAGNVTQVKIYNFARAPSDITSPSQTICR